MRNGLIFILALSLLFFTSCKVFKNTQGSRSFLTREQQIANTSLFIDAEKEKNLGNYEDAKTLLKKCIQNDPHNAATMLSLIHI